MSYKGEVRILFGVGKRKDVDNGILTSSDSIA
jgi:hypothetical protein